MCLIGYRKINKKMTTVPNEMDFKTLLSCVLEQAKFIKKASRTFKDCKIHNFKCDMVNGKLHSSWTIRHTDGTEKLGVTCIAPNEEDNHREYYKRLDELNMNQKSDNDTKKRKAQDTQKRKAVVKEPKKRKTVKEAKRQKAKVESSEDSDVCEVELPSEKKNSPLIYDLETS